MTSVTTLEYDELVAEVRKDRFYSDIIVHEEVEQEASLRPEEEVDDLEWSPLI